MLPDEGRENELIYTDYSFLYSAVKYLSVCA